MLYVAHRAAVTFSSTKVIHFIRVKPFKHWKGLWFFLFRPFALPLRNCLLFRWIEINNLFAHLLGFNVRNRLRAPPFELLFCRRVDNLIEDFNFFLGIFQLDDAACLDLFRHHWSMAVWMHFSLCIFELVGLESRQFWRWLMSDEYFLRRRKSLRVYVFFFFTSTFQKFLHLRRRQSRLELGGFDAHSRPLLVGFLTVVRVFNLYWNIFVI